MVGTLGGGGEGVHTMTRIDGYEAILHTPLDQARRLAKGGSALVYLFLRRPPGHSSILSLIDHQPL